MTTDDIFRELRLIATDPLNKIKDRVKCLELMGKTHHMFIDKLQVEGEIKHQNKTDDEIRERIRKLERERKFDNI